MRIASNLFRSLYIGAIVLASACSSNYQAADPDNLEEPINASALDSIGAAEDAANAAQAGDPDDLDEPVIVKGGQGMVNQGESAAANASRNSVE